MKSLVHLKYCIKESVRLFPPVSAVGRVLAKSTDIDGHMMPVGTQVVCDIHAVHRNRDLWSDPDVCVCVCVCMGVFMCVCVCV